MSLADKMHAAARARWAKKGPEYAENRQRKYQEWQENQKRRDRVAEEQRQAAWRHYQEQERERQRQQEQQQQEWARQQQRRSQAENTQRLWEEAFGIGQPTRALSKERVKVIDKIQKLLRLAAGGTTAEESRTAATMAYKLIEEHKVEFK